MKHSLTLLLLVATVACQSGSKVSSSSVESINPATSSALEIQKTSKKAGIECAMTTQGENKYIFITGFKSGSEVRLHDVSGNGFLPDLEILDRKLPVFKETKKGLEASEDNLQLTYEDIDQIDNPDKMKKNAKVVGIKYRLILSGKVGEDGEIHRAYVYGGKRGIFSGRVGTYKNIANLIDCQASGNYHALAK